VKAQPQPQPQQPAPVAAPSPFDGLDDLVRGVIMAEVLAPPVALRDVGTFPREGRL